MEWEKNQTKLWSMIMDTDPQRSSIPWNLLLWCSGLSIWVGRDLDVGLCLTVPIIIGQFIRSLRNFSVDCIRKSLQLISIIIQSKKLMTSSPKQDKQKAIALSIGSSLAGMIAKIVTHPIDTIKAKLQVNRGQMRTISDIKFGNAIELGVAKKTWRAEGISGFFRGVTISVIGSSIAFSCYMSAYEYSKNKLKKHQFFNSHPTSAHFLAGLIAEVVSCTFWLPIDVIKQRLQVQSELNLYKYNGPRDAVKKIRFSEGVVGLYRAYGATLLFFGPFSAIFFSVYQKMKELVVKNKEKPTLVESIISSAAASTIAGYVVTPLQVVKLRMQIQRADVGMHGGTLEQSLFGYRNAFHGLYLMAKNQGFFALYKGGLMRICFSIPITTISMSLTEVFKHKIYQSHVFERFI